MKYKVGICQFEPKLLNVSYNLDKMKELLLNVKADLIVLPELASSGYLFNSKSEVEKVSEFAMDGPTATLFKSLSQHNDTSYVVGFPEKFEKKFYNSAMLVNPDGKIYVYRKTHLFYEEKLRFESGNSGFQIFKAKKDVPVGMMICFDWIFPESARTLALKGAQIIAHPANLVLPWCQQAMITRSLENRIFSITANRVGKKSNSAKELHFTGMSQILTTKGEIIRRFDKNEESVYVTEIETNDAQEKKITEFNDIFEDRKTKYYNLN